MDRENQTQLLLAEMEKQKIEDCEMTDFILNNLGELIYTAYENGIIPFKLYSPDDRRLMQLVLLAIHFGKDGVPDEFRM